MNRKRYTEEQIISILKEHEAGASVPDLARRHGVVENTLRSLGAWRCPRPSDYASWSRGTPS
jgi:transposase-like protein